MTNIFRILHLLLIIYSLILPIRTQPPLIFNGDTLEIYPDWPTATQNKGPYAVACPPYTSGEKEFNENGSLDQEALFVRGYTEQISFHMLNYKCDEYINLAAVVRKDAKSREKFVEFGYEVYIDKTVVDGRFKVSDFKKFSRLVPPTSLIKKPMNFIQNLVTDNSPYVKKEKIYYYDVSESPYEYVKLDFLWVPRAYLKYDFSKWNVQKLTYFITRDARDLLESCNNDYTLGMEFYGEDDVNSYYLDANQKTVFNEVILPENLLTYGGKCRVHTICVAPYSILSPYQFRSSPSKAFPCSSLDKIPLWYETAEEPLNYLEKFLVAAAQVTNQRSKIIVGTYKTLTLPSKKDKNPQEMFLHNKKMPIPKLIYKIVKFKPQDCNAEKESCWFDVVIVIHNQPEVKPEDLICDDKSEEWGWESIRFMSTTADKNADEKSKFIYVCELDKGMRTKLSYKSDTPNERNLQLNHFPYYNVNKTRIEFKNWQEKFERRMRELFEQPQIASSDKSEVSKAP